MRRNQIIKNAKRIVIKIGTGVLTSVPETDTFFGIDKCINPLVEQIKDNLCDQGKEVILVSSGAVGIGCRILGLTSRPTNIPDIQAAAAIGQIELMHLYKEQFTKNASNQVRVAQLLLTQDVVDNRIKFLNTRNTIMALLAKKVVPIINENDTVAVEEIRFGDNDNLAAIVANLADADLVINLTTVDGLLDPSNQVVAEVDKINAKIKRLAYKETSGFGTGGMLSKLEAAEKIMAAGGAMIIAQGFEDNILKRIFDGEQLGTMFFPGTRKKTRKRWIAHIKSSRGKIIVDDGAARALVKNGASLLAIGVMDAKGNFEAGDMVHIMNCEKTEIARGLVNYSAAEVMRIKGRKSAKFKEILGEKNKGYDELIHRDNLVLT